MPSLNNEMDPTPTYTTTIKRAKVYVHVHTHGFYSHIHGNDMYSVYMSLPNKNYHNNYSSSSKTLV